MTFGANGYGDWALELAGSNDAASKAMGDWWEPVFLRVLEGDGTPAKRDSATAFFKRAAEMGRAQGFHITEMEAQFHDALVDPNGAVELIAYRRLDQRSPIDGASGALRFEVLATGPVVHSDRLPEIARVEAGEGQAPDVVFGIIDDGIGPLHGRVRDTVSSTRTAKMLWLGAKPGAVPVQTKTQFDAELSRPVLRSEHDAYAEAAHAIYPPTTRHSLARAATHGAHMLDLATGADAGDALADVPVLAVQVAPASFDDPSGMLINFDILTGLRWLILQTALMSSTPTHLVVNMSLGYTAGPKNGRSFVEQAVTHLMDVAEVALGVTVHLTVPYGNGYSDNVIARSTIDPAATQDLSLRVQPDDRTPSFAEFRLTDQSAEGDLAQLQITLTPPRGGLQNPVMQLASGQSADLRDDAGRLIGRLYHVPARALFAGQIEPAMLLLALAPTVGLRSDADLTCPNGAWQMALTNCGQAAMDLTAQVQRDDDPSDRNTGARQARFEGVETRVWDVVGRDFEGVDEAAGRITRRGTNSALSTIAHPRAQSVGGALVRQDPSEAAHIMVEPAEYYGAEGADWSGHGPDLSAVSEVERASPGVTAAGLTSAATARLSGSSTSSATAARDLVERLRGAQPLPDMAHAAPDARLGARTITDSPAIRRRP